MRKLILICTALVLSACSSTSSLISKVPDNNHQLSQVSGNVGSFADQTVRWGGEIITISSDNGLTLVEVKQYPLNSYGFPLTNIPSQGKFTVETKQVLDSKEYQKGLLITFHGTITLKTKNTDELTKDSLPLIIADDSHLWPYRVANGMAYTIKGMESEYRGYGYYGSGHYQYY